jgi:hypothetical protein
LTLQRPNSGSNLVTELEKPKLNFLSAKNMLTFMLDPHPLRLWNHDRRLGEKIREWQNIVAKSQQQFGGPEHGIQLLSLEMPDFRSIINTFEDLHAVLYKQNDSMESLSVFSDFWNNHRQMFCLDGALGELLANTDVGPVPWEALKDPCPNYHVSWGDFGQESFEIRGFEYVIDGAYVRRLLKESVLFPKDTLLITFTSQLVWPSYREAKRDRASSTYHFREPCYEYAVSGLTGSTIGESMAAGELEYQKKARLQDENLFKLALQMAPGYGLSPALPSVEPILEKFKRGITLFRPFIPLLFNSIFYLTQNSKGGKEIFPPSFPKKTKRLILESRSDEEKLEQRRKAADKGYSTVLHFSEANQERHIPGQEGGRGVRSHWRRGHWRNQAFGTSGSSRRWTWIKPVLVRKDQQFSTGTKRNVAEIE